jgi:hypothetical protein
MQKESSFKNIRRKFSLSKPYMNGENLWNNCIQETKKWFVAVLTFTEPTKIMFDILCLILIHHERVYFQTPFEQSEREYFFISENE